MHEIVLQIDSKFFSSYHLLMQVLCISVKSSIASWSRVAFLVDQRVPQASLDHSGNQSDPKNVTKWSQMGHQVVPKKSPSGHQDSLKLPLIITSTFTTFTSLLSLSSLISGTILIVKCWVLIELVSKTNRSDRCALCRAGFVYALAI